MTLSIRNALRSLSLLAATVAFAPGCDDGQVEALGLSAEDIDAMSEAELDELAALEDLSDPVRPGEPDPTGNPDDLREPAVDQHHRPGTVDELGNPVHFTHAQIDADTLDEIRNPVRFTHAHKRPEAVPGLVNAVHPTHNSPVDNAVGELANEIDDGCDTHGDDPDYTNG